VRAQKDGVGLLGEDRVMTAAVQDPAVVARFLGKLVEVPGSECLWWTGAVSGRGHGRYWLTGTRVVIAHRFAFALVHGVEQLPDLLGHRCDNPLCQRISAEHVVASTASRNRNEWLARRYLAVGPLADPRGPRRRAQELRDLARVDPAAVRNDIDRVALLVGHQPCLF